MYLISQLDANHCPGAVMILFKMPNGLTHLHTGDFRYNNSHPDHMMFKELKIDHLFLDTTYCIEKYDFPSQISVFFH